MLPLILILAAWGELRPEGPPAVKGPAPKSSQRREVLDEFQGLLTQWLRERNEFSREVAEQQHAATHLEQSRGQPADDLGGRGAPNKAIEVRKGGVRPGRGKVLEFRPREKLEVDLEEAEAAAEERRAACKKDPGLCAAHRHEREQLEAADDAFEAAIEVNFEKRRAQIEAEGAKIQAEFNAARLHEANQQAKKLGGAVDPEGNFVDDELKAEPPPRRPE